MASQAAERLGAAAARGIALAKDVPVDIGAGGAALDHGVVGILRVGGQQAKAGHGRLLDLVF